MISTGSEIHPTLEAAEILMKDGIKARVVNMPCLEIFDRQTENYRKQVLPPEIESRLAIEAGASMGWHKYTGLKGNIIGIDRFGASAPANILLEKFGFTVENIVNRAKKLLRK